MAQLTRNQCRSLVYRYFLNEGWLPPGTTKATWPEVTMGDLGMDDPPLPGNPNIQKQRVALDLQTWFEVLGGKLPSPLDQLKKQALTLGDFAEWCFTNQKD